MRLDEIKKEKKKIGPRGGMVPYYHSDKGLLVYLMIPSDPRYGGPKKQIAKGGIEDGETPLEGATREAQEELGLKPENITDIEEVLQTDEVTLTDQYHLTVFAGKILDPDDWNEPHYETGWAGWVSINDAINKGRHAHRRYFEIIKQRYEI